MWSCKVVSLFWKEVIKWLNTKKVVVNLTYKVMCLGISSVKVEYYSFINMTLILAKRHIYKCRVQESILCFQDFKEWLLFNQKVEKQIALNKGKLEVYLKKWEPLL